MILLDGKEVKLKVLEELKEKLTKLDRSLGLVVIQVGNDPASNVYVRQKNKMAENLGYNFNHIKKENLRMKNYFIYLVLLFFLIAIPVSSQDKLTKILQK